MATDFLETHVSHHNFDGLDSRRILPLNFPTHSGGLPDC